MAKKKDEIVYSGPGWSIPPELWGTAVTTVHPIRKWRRTVNDQLPDNVATALKTILDYMWAPELSHYDNEIKSEGQSEGHVFEYMVAVRNWLDGTEKTPEEMVREGMRYVD